MSRLLACQRLPTRLLTTTSRRSASTNGNKEREEFFEPEKYTWAGKLKEEYDVRFKDDYDKWKQARSQADRFDANMFTFSGNKKSQKGDFHYSDRRSGPGYANFSKTIYPNRPFIWPPIRKYFYKNFYAALVFLILFIFDWEKIGRMAGVDKMFPSIFPEAAQLKPGHERDEIEIDDEGDRNNLKNRKTKRSSDSDSESESGTEVESVMEKPQKQKLGFRERRIIEYEDRLRMYSAPEKIFRYFATLKVLDPKDDSGRTFEVFMTPEDFLRSFTPGVMQPRRYGLDSYKIYQPDKHKVNFSDVDSIFYKLGENGLISYSDYLFLMMLLSTSPNDFALAFKIFDINGDGALDKDEFNRVKQLIMSQTSVGQKHRDHSTATSSFRVETNSALETYFFGKDGKSKLSAQKFLVFQESLHNDVLKMEFHRRDALDGIDGMISESAFAQLLLMHAQIPDKRQKTMIKRVKQKFNAKKGTQKGISFDETKDFFRFLYHIDAIDLALHFHRLAGKPIDAVQLKKVARRVTGVELTDHLIDVVIALFDDNMDGCLSNAEMVAVMRRRLMRGLERPRDTGLFRLVDAVYVCGKRGLTSMWS